MDVLTIEESEREGWEVCHLTNKEFYLNKGLAYFVGEKPVCYDEGLRLYKQLIKNSNENLARSLAFLDNSIKKFTPKRPRR